MPVSITSRYYRSAVYDATDPNGVSHPTVAIRVPTPPAAGTTLYRHLVTGVETLEHLAWRYYGDSSLWWRIAEANDIQFAPDLSPGMNLNIPAVSDLGTVVRTRRF